MCALANQRRVIRRNRQGKRKGRDKPFKNGTITLGEIRKAVRADKPSGIFKPIRRS